MVRRKKGLITFFMVLVTIFAIVAIFSTSTHATSDGAATVVNATFDIRFLDGTNLTLKVKLDAYRIKIFGESYNTTQIRESYDENKGAFKQVLYTYIENLINYMFPNCTNQLSPPYIDSSSLNGNANEPVVFLMDCNVSLTSKFFGDINIPSISTFVNGVLDMGGVISYNFNFYADLGWNTTYHFLTTEKMEIIEVNQNGKLSPNGKEVTWTVENREGTDKKYGGGTFKVRYANPTSKFDEEKVHLDISFDFRGIEEAELNYSINVFACKRDFITLPSFVSHLSFLPADGIRMFVQQNLTTWEEVYNNVFAPIRRDVENALNSSLKVSLNSSFSFNLSTTNCSQPYDVLEMNENPPISGTLKDHINISLCNIPLRAFFAFIYAGGTGRLTESDIPLSGIKYPFDAHLILPEDLNGSTTWNNSKELNIVTFYKNAPVYKEESIDRDVEIDLRGFDLDLIGLLTGKSNLVATIDVNYNQRIYHISPQPEFRIPPCISIPYLNSDLIRVCIEEGVFDSKNMSDFLERQREFAEQHVSEIFDMENIDMFLNQALLDKSMEWDGNVKDMDDEIPFTIPFSTHLSYKTVFSFHPFSLYIRNQGMIFKGIPGQKVTYRFIVPKGVNIIYNDSLNRTVATALDDGRTMVEISFNEDEGDLQTVLYYSLETSTLFTFIVFLPFIVAVIIVIVLLAILIHIKRRKLPPKPPREERYIQHIPPESEM